MLNHHDPLRIAHCRRHTLQCGMLHQRPGRTNQRALSAIHTTRNIHALVKRRSNGGPASTADKLNRGDFLHLFTNPDAFSAENTFGSITDQSRTRQVAQFSAEPLACGTLADTVLLRKQTEVAVTAFRTVKAIVRVIGKQKLQQNPAGADHFLRIGMDPHSLRHGIGTRGNQPISLRTLDLYNTDPAGSGRRHTRQMAKRRNANTDTGQCGKNRFPLLGINDPVVHSNLKHNIPFNPSAQRHEIYKHSDTLRTRCISADQSGAGSGANR